MGTISQKILYLNETKQRQKTLINALGGNITNDTPFREYATQLDAIYSKLPKATGEGSNISLSPTLKGKLDIESLKGDTEQETLTGKNLFNPSLLEGGNISTSTGEPTASGNYVRTSDYISVEPDTNYAYQYITQNTSKQIVIYQYDGSKNFITFTVIDSTSGSRKTGATTYYIKIRFQSTSQDISTVSNIQLEKSSSATSYEPYCGGIPSPNPNYPQDIQVVTGTQEVEIVGRNLFSCDIELGSIASGNRIDSSTIYRTDDFIKVLPNTDYIFSINGSANRVAVSFYTQNKTWINRDSSAQGTLSSNGKFTTPSNCEYILMRSYTDDFNLWATRKLQLELGSTATTYSPYTSQTYTLHLGDLELAKIGSYQDYIYYNNGKWYLQKINKKIDLKDYTDLHRDNNWGNTTAFYFVDTVNRHGVSGFATVADLYCNRLISDTPAQIVGVASKVNKIGLGNNNCIYFSISGITTDSGYITYFSNNPTYLYFKLETPITTEITNETLLSDLEYIRTHAMSYTGTTNISSSGNLPIIISASALKGE